MTDTRATLRERYRSTLAARTQRIAELVPACRRGESADPAGQADVGPAAEMRELMGELHTLKGEARMLGYALLATLCHVLEDRFRDAAPDFDALSVVLDGILLSLAPGMSDAEAAELWRTSLEALGAAPDDDETRDPATPEPATPASGSKGGGTRWAQVDATVVDTLCEKLAALATDLGRYTTGAGVRPANGVQTGSDDDAERLRAGLNEALLLALDLRLHPVEPLLTRLAAHARVLGSQRGQTVDVQVLAQGVRIEREILDRIGDPLLHVVQNAVEHGIELPHERGGKAPTARIELIAETSGATVTIRVRDDGRGVDREAVLARARREGRIGRDGRDAATVDAPERQLDVLFQAGFSTRETVDEGAGRGVGLDVVRRAVEGLGGTVHLESERGRGTELSISVPAALTQERLVVVRSGEVLYGIPSRWVLSIERRRDAAKGKAERAKGSRAEPEGESAGDPATFSYRDETLPLGSLAAVVGAPETEDEPTVLVLRLGERPHALACAGVVDHAELLRRPTTRALSEHCGVSASAQLDDGRLVLLLDVGFLRQGLSRGRGTSLREQPRGTTTRHRVLVVDDSVVVRDLLSEVLVTAGYQVETAQNGKEALTSLGSFQPDLIVSDIEMPEMDGFDLLRAIRSRTETLPVVLVTARSSAEDRRKASALGASAYVAKGEFQSESLIHVVRRYCPEET